MNAPNDYKPSFRGLALEHSGWRHSRNLIYASFASLCAHFRACDANARICAHFRAWDANARIFAHGMRMRAYARISRMRCECSHMRAFPRMRCDAMRMRACDAMRMRASRGNLCVSGTVTHWGRDKMDAISQTTFSSAFSCFKMFEFRLKFHWSLFLRFQWTVFQHWFR